MKTKICQSSLNRYFYYKGLSKTRFLNFEEIKELQKDKNLYLRFEDSIEIPTRDKYYVYSCFLVEKETDYFHDDSFIIESEEEPNRFNLENYY